MASVHHFLGGQWRSFPVETSVFNNYRPTHEQLKTTMTPVVKVIQPSGLLDGTKATLVRKEIDEIVSSGASVVLIDLQEVTFIDSSGLGALVSALKAVRAAGGKLFICSINAQVRMLFELTSMDRVFQIFANRDEFNKAVISN